MDISTEKARAETRELVMRQYQFNKQRQNEVHMQYLASLPVTKAKERAETEQLLAQARQNQASKPAKPKQYDVQKPKDNTKRVVNRTNSEVHQVVGKKRPFDNTSDGTNGVDESLMKVSRVNDSFNPTFPNPMPSYDVNSNIQPNINPFQQKPKQTNMSLTNTDKTVKNDSNAQIKSEPCGNNSGFKDLSLGDLDSLNSYALFGEVTGNTNKKVKVETNSVDSKSTALHSNSMQQANAMQQSIAIPQTNPSQQSSTMQQSNSLQNNSIQIGNNMQQKHFNNNDNRNLQANPCPPNRRLEKQVPSQPQSAGDAPPQSTASRNVSLDSLNAVLMNQQNQSKMMNSNPMSPSLQQKQQMLSMNNNISSAISTNISSVNMPAMKSSGMNNMSSGMNNMSSGMNTNNMTSAMNANNMSTGMNMSSGMPPNMNANMTSMQNMNGVMTQPVIPPNLQRPPNLRQQIVDKLNRQTQQQQQQQQQSMMGSMMEMNNPYGQNTPGQAREKLQEHLKKRHVRSMFQHQMTRGQFVNPQQMISPMQNSMHQQNPFQFPPDFQAFNQQKMYEQMGNLQSNNGMGFYPPAYQMEGGGPTGGGIFPNNQSPGYSQQQAGVILRNLMRDQQMNEMYNMHQTSPMQPGMFGNATKPPPQYQGMDSPQLMNQAMQTGSKLSHFTQPDLAAMSSNSMSMQGPPGIMRIRSPINTMNRYPAPPSLQRSANMPPSNPSTPETPQTFSNFPNNQLDMNRNTFNQQQLMYMKQRQMQQQRQQYNFNLQRQQQPQQQISPSVQQPQQQQPPQQQQFPNVLPNNNNTTNDFITSTSKTINSNKAKSTPPPPAEDVVSTSETTAPSAPESSSNVEDIDNLLNNPPEHFDLLGIFSD